MNHCSHVSRRTWIAGTLCGMAGLGLQSGRAEEAEPLLDIIDCHTHFYDPARPQGVPWPKPGTPLYRTVLPSHLRALKQFRPVTGTVVVEASPRVEDNAWLLELAQSDPFIVGIVGNLTPGSDDFARQLGRFAANPLFRGIRVASPILEELVARRTLMDLQRLADHNLSLDANGGPESLKVVAELASRLPDLRIVQNHIGNVELSSDPPPKEWQEGMRAAAQHPNVFCKISALVEGASRNGQTAPDDPAFYKPFIDVVWNAFGDDRVIYGSNWPVSERAASYEKLQRLVLEYAFEKGDEATAKFCSLNAKRAYKWVERPGRR